MPVTLTAITFFTMLTVTLILEKGLVSLFDSHVVDRLFAKSRRTSLHVIEAEHKHVLQRNAFESSIN